MDSIIPNKWVQTTRRFLFLSSRHPLTHDRLQVTHVGPSSARLSLGQSLGRSIILRPTSDTEGLPMKFPAHRVLLRIVALRRVLCSVCTCGMGTSILPESQARTSKNSAEAAARSNGDVYPGNCGVFCAWFSSTPLSCIVNVSILH